MKRRVLCLILAVIMVACLLPTAAFASTNGKTADDAINWVKSLEGQPVGSGECVALIKAYYSYLGQTSPGGNGADYSWNQLPAGWHRLQNAQPQKGDILVYSGNGENPYGHVAIYESDYSTWHQNFASQRKVVHVTNIRYNGFTNPYWGVIRPDFGSAVFKPDFINIGTNVYRYIIRADGWKHIGTNYDSSNRSNVTIGKANTGDPDQIWKFIRQGDGSYYIQNEYKNFYLCYEGNCASGAKVTTSYKLASSCYWYIANYNGLCKLVAKDSVASGNWLVVDCTGGSATPGTQLQLYGNWGPNDSNGNAQLFNIYTVENYQKPAAPPKVEITVPDVATVGEETKISWTASPLQGKYDQREYCVIVEGGGSKKVIYTTDTSVSVTIKRRELHCNVTVDAINTKYASYSSSSYASFRCVEAHEHSYKAVVTAPTCTSKGCTTHTCACGDSYVDTYVDALGHAWDNGKVTKEPTETETGVKTFTCTRCGETRTETMPVIPHVHSYKDVVTAPTCTEKGYTTHTCSCGDSYVDTYVDALGHAWDSGTVTKQPTATETGVRTYTCTRCSATKTETIPATGSVDVTQMFTDVTKNWAYPGIQYCVTHGIMGGMGDGTFAPTGTTTRAQIVQILYNLEGTPAVSGTTPFTDLTANWYKPAILWAYQNNVVAGTSPTTFDPDQPVTREQIAVILTQYMFHVLKMERTWTPADLSKFPDGAQVSGWAKAAMQDAVALGLINGTKAPDDKVYLDPQGSAARQQVATILMNFCQNVKK
mgnify:CR=1 FL=1